MSIWLQWRERQRVSYLFRWLRYNKFIQYFLSFAIQFILFRYPTEFFNLQPKFEVFFTEFALQERLEKSLAICETVNTSLIMKSANLELYIGLFIGIEDLTFGCDESFKGIGPFYGFLRLRSHWRLRGGFPQQTTIGTSFLQKSEVELHIRTPIKWKCQEWDHEDLSYSNSFI